MQKAVKSLDPSWSWTAFLLHIATPRLCIVYLYIHVLYVIGSKEDDLASLLEVNGLYIPILPPSPFLHQERSVATCQRKTDGS